MSKIAIISQPDRGVLIDVGGCTTLQEAAHHLTSTLQISSQFWNGMNVELNLGQLQLSQEEVSQVMSIAAEVGVKPGQVFASNELTKAALIAHNIKIASGKPMSLPTVTLIEDAEILTEEETEEIIAEVAVVSAPQVAEQSEQPVAVLVEQQKDNSGPGQNAEPVSEPLTTHGAQQAGAQAAPQPPAVLYLRQTLRSGQAVSHQGHLVIIGDVNPGAEVMAEGDITVWGVLRGIAHAGISGNTAAEIRALRLQAIQLRIAHAIARSPDRPRKHYSSHTGPETARIVNGSIRIAKNIPE